MQHKKYKALYKCRVCGHTYSANGTDNENLAVESTIDALSGDSIVELTEIHRCEDGGIGIADFCGFTRDGYSERKVKTLEEIYQMLGLKGPCFSYQKINNTELEPLFERVLNGKNDFVAFYTENQKGYAPKLVICEKQDIEIIRNSLKNDPNIRVVSAGAFCNGVTLLEVHELLESDLKEIKE